LVQPSQVDALHPLFALPPLPGAFQFGATPTGDRVRSWAHRKAVTRPATPAPMTTTSKRTSVLNVKKARSTPSPSCQMVGVKAFAIPVFPRIIAVELTIRNDCYVGVRAAKVREHLAITKERASTRHLHRCGVKVLSFPPMEIDPWQMTS
jgi:hypothetical protein